MGGLVGGATTRILAAAVTSSGGAPHPFSILNPGSALALSQRELFLIALGLMMVVLIPVWVMSIWFPWKYRADHEEAEYRPRWAGSVAIESAIWAVPTIIVVAIAALLWVYTHRLDPYKVRPGNGAPLNIQAVSLDWKWVFLYPDQKVATVDDLMVPVGRPVTLHITSDTVMNSFFIPGLAGQIFAMAGMETRLNFTGRRPGDYRGRNTQYSAGRFPDEHFAVHVVPPEDFAAWAARAASSKKILDQARYARLSSERGLSLPQTFVLADPDLFASVLAKYCSIHCPSTKPPEQG